MVFYRKYRPQQISDLDSEGVRRKLFSVLSTSAPTFLQVPHAFLFTGPKGLGKTSTARIVAKVINCSGRKDTSGKDLEPCNVCDQCTSITSGTNLDVFEIDAASNRGIDEIRDLKEKIRLSPVSAKKKVYIIDEVHMLTTEAFNALLKTLEEPPSHAVFILCTTESHKIPATILSRCFHIVFKRATDNELVHAFKRIVKGEELKIDDGTLFKIAKLADGGFRDGTKILEELVSLSEGKDITEGLFEEKYQITNVSQKIEKLLIACEQKDIKVSMEIVSELIAEGIDVTYFIAELIATLHILLLQKVGIEGEEKIESNLELSDIKSLLQLFAKAAGEMKYTIVPSLPLEIALVEWSTNTVESRAQSSELSKKTLDVIDKKVEQVTLSTLRKQVGNMVKERAINGDPVGEKEIKIKIDPAEVSILKFAATGEHSQEWIDALWKNMIMEIKNHNHMIAGVLRSCRLVGYDRKILIIEAASKFHKERLEESKTFEALNVVCTELIGNSVEIKIALKQ
ncbi:DNA polymerase III subunit gamma/tau [soil metagenome]